MHDTTAIDRHAIPPPPPRSDPPQRDTEPDAGPWLCLAGEATVRDDVAPLALLEPVASAVAGEP